MTTAALIAIVIFALTAILVMSVLCAVLIRESLHRSYRALSTQQSLHEKQMAGLLDRFQAIRWEDLVAMRSMEEDEEVGGFLTPEEQAEEDGGIIIQEPGAWGTLSRLNERLRLTAEEEEIIDEDFDEFGEPRRSNG